MSLTRTRHTMPDYIREALTERHLMEAYHTRPDYQQNDYIGWITRAKREETQQKRLAQMLDELEGGKLYMNMKWAKSPTVHSRRSAKKQA
jgi:uncharacterized protein YdeI (YjbR/CyaY-like superfamily)